jgi:hypothetical protein
MIYTVERNTGQLIKKVALIAELFSARRLNKFRGVQTSHTRTSLLCAPGKRREDRAGSG